MLVLSRKTSQRIRVGDVTITVVRIGANSVRIGIDAPPSVNIARDDLLTPLATQHSPLEAPCPARPAA